MIRALTALGLAVLVSPAMAQSFSYRCPEPGTVLERSAGGPIAFRSSDPNDPLVCLAGAGQRLVLGVWAPNDRLYVNGRAELTALLNSAGGERRFNYFSVGRDSNSIQVFESWRFAGFEPIRVAAGSFDAARLERRFDIAGTTYTYTQTVWIDRVSHVPVRVVVTHLNSVMAPTLFDWEATEIRRPAGGRLGS